MTIQSNLTLDEIQNLIAALKAWETQPSTEGFTGALLGAMLCGLGSPEERSESKARAKADSERGREKSERDCAIRREQSVLLQAKLIQIKNQILSGE